MSEANGEYGQREQALELAKAITRGECSTFGDEVPLAAAFVSYALQADTASALVRDAAWQLNEALSMLREAASHTNTDPREQWVEDFREGEEAMQGVLERLAHFGGSEVDR